MNTRWTSSLAVFAAVLFCGASLATAAAPNIGQNRSPTQGSVGIVRVSTLMGTTVLDSHGQKLGRIKDVLLDSQTGQVTVMVLDAEVPGSGHPTTYTAARPTDNASMPAPALPQSAVAAPSLPPCVVPSPRVSSADPGWTQDLEDFYNE
ncbi:MAG: PRC-barrel domain-containing protein [Thermoguttaceae bacterium]